ncbi:MAG TPA: PDZ domain-containing protein, partial [Candidatus Methanoperedens sp.]|nr:PDZ domain-containing protein [Candidatus Methanoperedens sp.]
EEGDLVLTVGGTPVRSAGEFHYQVGRRGAGEPLELGLLRGKKSLALTVRAEQFTPKVAATISWEWLGLAVKESRAGLAVAKVKTGGVAAEIGLEPGDLVLQVGGEEARTEEEYAHGVMLAFQRGTFPMLVQRGRRGYYVTLPIRGRSL